MTSFAFRETLMTHLLLYGNAYAQIIQNGKGEVIALYPLMANQMSVDRDAKGHLYSFSYSEFFVFPVPRSNATTTVTFFTRLFSL